MPGDRRLSSGADVGGGARDRAGRGRPPNSAEPMLAQPCAITSALGRWLPPIIRSATIAESSDSTAARNAITKAEGSSSAIREPVTTGSEGIGRLRGSAPYCEAIVSTGSTSTAPRRPKPAPSPDQPVGHARAAACGPHDQRAARRRRRPPRSSSRLPRAAHSAAILGRKSAGRPRGLDPGEVLELAGGDDDRDADGEAVDDRPRAHRRSGCPPAASPATTRIAPAISVASTSPS